MHWNVQRLRVSLRTDLHCGDRPLGFIARTFPFIPCHIPFFALVPASVQLLGMPDQKESYVQMEALFSAALRCSPLYILDNEKPLFPWKEEDLNQIESKYILSRDGVALDLQNRSADDKKLFEIEVILAFPRTGASLNVAMPIAIKPTQLEGALFWHPAKEGKVELDSKGILHYGKKTASLQKALAAMQIGGNRTRCLGLLSSAELTNLPDKKLWDCSVIEESEWPQLVVPSGIDGPIPLSSKETQAKEIQGKSSVLTGRRYKRKQAGVGGAGSGLSMDKASIVFLAGWTCKDAVTISLTEPRFAKVIA